MIQAATHRSLLVSAVPHDLLEDLIITTAEGYHLLRLVRTDSDSRLVHYVRLDRIRGNLAVARRRMQTLFLYVALRRDRSNPAMARHQFERIEADLDVRRRCTTAGGEGGRSPSPPFGQAGPVTSVRDTVAGMLGGTIDYETGLDVLTVAPPAEVDPALAALLHDTVAALARAGWQPAELHRVVARRGDPLQGRLVTDAITEHLRGFRDVDPRWRAQADELRRAAGPRRRADRVSLLDATLRLIGTLRRLPPIEVLVPPPGTAAPARAASASADVGLLNRVRALLAKAESTDFPAEAEAYSAKAQELIARHSIADALAEHTAPVVPYARRIGVDHPYENEKASLLDAVARANRCHTVWSPELGFTTVFGFDADIDGVELLYTSLLLQGHRAMAAAEPRGGRARIKAFRRSFLIAYAVRIGERLEHATAAAVAAESADLLPVLASRDAQVRETMDRIFPATVRARGSRVDSHEGWESGRAAADRADL